MKQTITIQPEPSPEEAKKSIMPYPYHLSKDGSISRQEFWKGKPFRVMGFNGEPINGPTDNAISMKEFWNNPTLAVGLYPIVEHSNGEWFTETRKIESVHVNIKG